jgi:hypothetical protein
MSRVCSRLYPLLLIVCCLLPASARAVESPDGKRMTVYGLFRQSAQGGILLESPEEPGVVYLPFDATAIMSDVLNIQVQVRGELRDTFTRDGKTVRVLAVTDIKPMTAEYGSTRVIDQAAFGLPGADTVQIRVYHDATCYLYDRYAVLERQAPGFVGHALRVLARHPDNDPAAACENLQGEPLFTIDHAADYTFAGLSGETLLLQKGLPQQVHGLMAVNLAQARQILDTVVVPGETITGHVLGYRQQVQAPCPAGKIAARPMTLNFVTGRSRDIGKTVCWP